jgi:plastocyanin
MKLVILLLIAISVLVCNTAFADSTQTGIKGSGFALLNGDSPKMYTSSVKISLHSQTTVDSGYVIIISEHPTIAKIVPSGWQFAYNNDGSFHATGPVTSRQNVSYSLVLDGNRLLTSEAGSLWKVSAEMIGNSQDYLLEYLASGKDSLVSAGASLTASVTIPNGNSAQSSEGFFVPLNLEILPGTTVTWQNQDNIGHTIQSINDKGTIIPMFNSPVLKTGDTFVYKFTKPGVYHYYCSIHPWRIGVVTVS